MSQEQNYYQILQVAPTATLSEIKAAFRRLARQFHPDLNPHNPIAAERFRQVCQAYEVLSDWGERSRYDQHIVSLTDKTRNGVTAEDYYLRAIKKAIKRDYQGALLNYSQAIALNPQFIDAYLKRCELRYKLQDDRGVLADCHEILQIKPNTALAYYYQGRSRYRLGYTEAAIEAYSQALDYQADYAPGYYYRAIAYTELGTKELAIADLLKSVHLFKLQGDHSGYELAQDTLKNIHKRRIRFKLILKFTQKLVSISWHTFSQVIVNPSEGLESAFNSLERQEAVAVGLIYAAIANLSFIVSAYSHWRYSEQLSLWQLLIVGFVPFISLTACSRLIRCFFSNQGSLAGDIWITGITLLPITLLLVISHFARTFSETLFGVLTIFTCCYTVLILYNGYILVSKLNSAIAALAVPAMLIVSGWLYYLILQIIL